MEATLCLSIILDNVCENVCYMYRVTAGGDRWQRTSQKSIQAVGRHCAWEPCSEVLNRGPRGFSGGLRRQTSWQSPCLGVSWQAVKKRPFLRGRPEYRPITHKSQCAQWVFVPGGAISGPCSIKSVFSGDFVVFSLLSPKIL